MKAKKHLKQLIEILEIDDYETIVLPYARAYIRGEIKGEELDSYDQHELKEGLRRSKLEKKSD
jgi:hypothetical protein